MGLEYKPNNRQKNYYDTEPENNAASINNAIQKIMSEENLSFDRAAKIYQIMLFQESRLAQYYNEVFNDSNFDILMKQLGRLEDTIDHMKDTLKESLDNSQD